MFPEQRGGLEPHRSVEVSSQLSSSPPSPLFATLFSFLPSGCHGVGETEDATQRAQSAGLLKGGLTTPGEISPDPRTLESPAFS